MLKHKHSSESTGEEEAWGHTTIRSEFWFRQLFVGSTMLRSFCAPGPSGMGHCISTNALDTIRRGYSATTRSLLKKNLNVISCNVISEL